MRSDSTPPTNRRSRRQATRRTRRRPVLTVGVLAVGVVAAAALTGAVPHAAAAAAPLDLSTATFQLASATTPLGLSSDQVAPLTDTPPRTASTSGTADAGTVVSAATATVQSATAVQSDIAASGLDIGQPATVDTSALQTATARLEAARVLPASFLPSVAGEVTAAAATVDQRVSELRGSLDGAIAKKQAEEAAEKARQEAEAAAAAQAKADAQARASQSSNSGSGGSWTPRPSSGGGSGDNSPGGAQSTARGMLAGYGWGDDQFSCVVSLWNRESGWNFQAYNSGSGAYGIPQALPGSKMSSAGADWQTNAGTQISWGLGYISGRYGSPCGAWDHSQATGWY